MVNMRVSSLTLKDVGGSINVNDIAEMYAFTDELHYKNQALEDNVLNVRQRQQETNPQEEMEVLDPQAPLRQNMGNACP